MSIFYHIRKIHFLQSPHTVIQKKAHTIHEPFFVSQSDRIKNHIKTIVLLKYFASIPIFNWYILSVINYDLQCFRLSSSIRVINFSAAYIANEESFI